MASRGSQAPASRGHEALGEDADAALAVPLQPGLVHCRGSHSSSPRPSPRGPWAAPSPGVGGVVCAHLHTARPPCPPAGGPSPRAPGLRSGAGPPPGRGWAGPQPPAAEAGLRQEAQRGGCLPTPAVPCSAYPALELQPPMAGRPPSPLQRLLLVDGHPGPRVAWGLATELPQLGLVREGLGQQGPQAGQVGSSLGPQRHGERTLHGDCHQGLGISHSGTLEPGRSAGSAPGSTQEGVGVAGAEPGHG